VVSRCLPCLVAFFLLADAAQAGLARFQCRVKSSEHTLDLEFVHDTTTNKAHMVGNVGPAEVIPHVGARTVTFLEFLPTGAVQSTTIALATGAAVHSRHSIVGNQFVPSQYRGTCSSGGTAGTP
jgi:hypothetical protein